MIQTARAASLIGQAVMEAVGAFATAQRADQVVGLALRWARLPHIPERGPEVAEFVEGPLFLAAEEMLGEEAARAIRSELAPIALQVDPEEITAVRTSWPSGPVPDLSQEDDFPVFALHDARVRTPLTPTDPAPRLELPVLLVASCDPTEVQRLALALSGIAYLEPVSDALAILEGLGGTRTQVVVVDLRRPTIQTETLLAIQPELPPGTRVLVWGERGVLRKQLAGLGPGVPDDWIVCGADATAEEVARICERLVT